MGMDEHGPAYPEPTPHNDWDHISREKNALRDVPPGMPEPPKSRYRCPVCDWDETAYLRCNHPGCPDGRDRAHPNARTPWLPGEPLPAERKQMSNASAIILGFIIGACILSVFLVR